MKSTTLMGIVAFSYVAMGGCASSEVVLHKIPTISERKAQLAECMADSDAKIFGAYWCPACAIQMNEFGQAGSKVLKERGVYVECSEEMGTKEGRAFRLQEPRVTSYPTWQFGDSSNRVKGAYKLETLAELSGCKY